MRRVRERNKLGRWSTPRPMVAGLTVGVWVIQRVPTTYEGAMSGSRDTGKKSYPIAALREFSPERETQRSMGNSHRVNQGTYSRADTKSKGRSE